MAARSLPQHQQRKAIFWGSAAAIVMRIVLTIAAVQLLTLPYLKLIGGALLIWIGVQLLIDSEEEGEVKSHGTLGAAVRTILIADLVMSLDNVIAVAGAAARAPEAYRLPLLVIGLVLSIPLIIVGSTLLMKVMDRFPIIITLGAALLGFLAGEMFVSDPATAAWFTANFPDAGVYVGSRLCACSSSCSASGCSGERRAGSNRSTEPSSSAGVRSAFVHRGCARRSGAVPRHNS